MEMVDLYEVGQFSLGEGKSFVEREKDVFKDRSAKWCKMWLLPTGTHALWQNIFGVTFEVNEPTIISTPCQLILERQAFAVKEMLLTKEALPFRVKTKTELCCLYSEIVLIIAKAKNVFQANPFYGFFYLVVLSL